MLSARLLGSEIAGGAEHGAGGCEGVEADGARDPEVGDTNVPRIVQEQVGRLDVPVDDPGSMGGVESSGGLPQPRQGASGLLGSLGREAIGQRASRQVLHHDVRAAPVLADVEDRDRVRRVRKSRRCERLVREASPDPLVVGEALGEHLHRDDPSEHAVLGPVDLAHPAAGDALRLPIAWGQDLAHRAWVPPPPERKTPGTSRRDELKVR